MLRGNLAADLALNRRSRSAATRVSGPLSAYYWRVPVAELPAMQEKGAVFARVRAAAEVAKRAHYYEGQQNELNGILSEMAEHERQRAIAIEQGDREREEAQRALILTCGTQRGIRKGAADAAKRSPHVSESRQRRRLRPMRKVSKKRKLRRDLSPHGLRALQ